MHHFKLFLTIFQPVLNSIMQDPKKARQVQGENSCEEIGSHQQRKRSIDKWTSEEQSSNTPKPKKNYLELVLALFKILHSTEFQHQKHETTALLNKYLDFKYCLLLVHSKVYKTCFLKL